MKVFTINKDRTLDEVFDYLENKMKLNEVVKINGELYQRIRPFNNKYYKNKCKFSKLNNNVSDSTVILIDNDGDETLTIPDYKVVFK